MMDKHLGILKSTCRTAITTPLPARALVSKKARIRASQEAPNLRSFTFNPRLRASAVEETDTQSQVPPPPYTFGAQLWYQLQLVPVQTARKNIPEPVPIVSLFGWTLGGVFIARWNSSPIGPYQEVAVLGGLVSKRFTFGAWASHIYVDSPIAIDAARQIWGLPGVLATIDIAAASDTKHLTFQEIEGTVSPSPEGCKTWCCLGTNLL